MPVLDWREIMSDTKTWTCIEAQDDPTGLFGADPECPGTVHDAPGGGVKCDTCPGWFCF